MRGDTPSIRFHGSVRTKINIDPGAVGFATGRRKAKVTRVCRQRDLHSGHTWLDCAFEINYARALSSLLVRHIGTHCVSWESVDGIISSWVGTVMAGISET